MPADGLTERLNSYFFGKMHDQCRSSNDCMRAIDWCQKSGLIATKFDCPTCGEPMRLTKKNDHGDNFEWVCRKKGHIKKRSVRGGSFFENSKLSMPKILLLVWYWVNDTPQRCVINEMDVGNQTVSEWSRFCREVCVGLYMEPGEKIGGAGRTVELYESNCSAKTTNDDCRWVFGGVEKDTDKCFLAVVPEKSSDCLLNVLYERVHPESTLVSNCWQSYRCLEDMMSPRIRKRRRTDSGDEESSSNWTVVKGGQRPRGMSEEQLDGHLAEYMWRRRNKMEIQRKFLGFLNAIKKDYVLSG